MPIGVTAAGDLVFPLTCRDFIERHRASDQKSAEVERPISVEKSISTEIATGEGKPSGSTETVVGKAPGSKEIAAGEGKAPGMPSYTLVPEPAVGPGEPIPSKLKSR
jgi:hypothetical protein